MQFGLMPAEKLTEFKMLFEEFKVFDKLQNQDTIHLELAYDAIKRN